MFILFSFTLGIMFSCERTTTIPLDIPTYEPQLMIFGTAGPLSGAHIIVKYSQPLEGLPGQVPTLPDLKISLMGNNGSEYLLQEDSSGYYSLPGKDLHLNSETMYYLMVVNRQTQEFYQSSPVSLPEQPEILGTEIEVDSANRGSFLDITLGAINEPVDAFSIHYIRLDSAQKDLESRSFSSRIQGHQMHYPEQEIWDSKKFSAYVENYVRIENNETVNAYFLDVEVTYLSKDLARYARDVNETDYYGEDIFQAVRPVFSNIQGNHGIFGLFNEAVLRIEINN